MAPMSTHANPQRAATFTSRKRIRVIQLEGVDVYFFVNNPIGICYIKIAWSVFIMLT